MDKMISKLILIYPIIQGIVSLIFNGEMQIGRAHV